MKDHFLLPIISADAPATRQERCDAVLNRRLLLATARHLFKEHGVDGVTMADIAKSAEVGKGTLYRRFANKGELCHALMDQSLQEFQEEILKQLREDAASGKSYRTQIDFFLGRLLQFTLDHRALLAEVQKIATVGDGQFDFPHKWQWTTLRGLLMRAQQTGEISAESDVDYLASAIISLLSTSVLNFQINLQQFSAERINAGLRSLISRKFGQQSIQGNEVESKNEKRLVEK